MFSNMDAKCNRSRERKHGEPTRRVSLYYIDEFSVLYFVICIFKKRGEKYNMLRGYETKYVVEGDERTEKKTLMKVQELCILARNGTERVISDL